MAAVACREEELEERQGLVPGAAPAVAWVFELGSYNQGPEGLGKWGRNGCRQRVYGDLSGSGRA